MNTPDESKHVVIRSWPETLSLAHTEAPWAVAHVYPRAEKVVARACVTAAVPHWLPLLCKRTRRPGSGKWQTSQVPLFPGYLPVILDEPGRRQLLETSRIVQILEVADPSRFLFDLAQLQNLAERGIPILGVEPLQPGETVRVTEGPLQGMVGTIQDHLSRTRLLIRIEALNASLSLSLDSATVERISNPSTQQKSPSMA